MFGGEGKRIYTNVNNANKKLSELKAANNKRVEDERKKARQEQIKTLEKFAANNPFLNKKSQNVKNIINQQKNTNVAKNMITKLSNQIKVNRKQQLSNFLNTNNARNHINNKNTVLNLTNKEPKKSVESIIADLKKQIEKSKKEAQIKKEAKNRKAEQNQRNLNVQNLKGLHAGNKEMMEKIERYRTAQKNGWFGKGNLYYNSINALKTNIETLEKKRAANQFEKNLEEKEKENNKKNNNNKNNNNNNNKPKLTKSTSVNNNAANAVKRKNVQNLRNKYGKNENYNAIKKHINKFEKGGWFAAKTKEEVETQITKYRELALEKREKEAEKKEQEKKENNEWKNKPNRPTLGRSGPINKNVANNKVNSVKRIELANKVKKYIQNNNVKTLETNRIVEKIIAGSITNYNKAILEVNKEIKKKQPSNNNVAKKLAQKQIEVNKMKKEAEAAKAEAAEKKKKREESNRKAKEAANKKAAANKALANFEKAEKEAANKKAKEEANRKAKEAANKKAKEEANRLEKEKEKKQKLLSKILNNSKNLPNTNKMAFLKRFEKGENFNAIKSNAIGKAKELAKQRKEKEEANRKAKEAMIAKKKEEALAKKKKEDEEKKKKEAENKKKASQNTQMRVSLTKKVKETQMNQKIKNKLLNQLKNYSVQIRNIAPGIEQTIKSEKLNGNFNEAENKKKRQEVKKNIAKYLANKHKNMSKADRKKYIDRANLKEWRKGIFRGTQGMGANQAYKRIIGNIERNMEAKKAANNKAKEEANRKAKEANLKRKQVQAKLINAMKNKPPPPPKNKKANLKKLVNNTMGKRAAKNVSRLKKNINEGVSEMAVKTRLAQLNKRTKYQK